MDGFPSERLSIDQATWIGSVLRVRLDDLSLEYARKDLIKGEPIRLNLLIGVVGDPNTIATNGFDDALDIHGLIAFHRYVLASVFRERRAVCREPS